LGGNQPRTGKRRIDEVFIDELFTKRETDMFIKCKVNASTWQCLGSDNYEGSIGSSPKGIVYSEWPQANPSARGYLRPIIAENDGWQIFYRKRHGVKTTDIEHTTKQLKTPILLPKS